MQSELGGRDSELRRLQDAEELRKHAAQAETSLLLARIADLETTQQELFEENTKCAFSVLLTHYFITH